MQLKIFSVGQDQLVKSDIVRSKKGIENLQSLFTGIITLNGMFLFMSRTRFRVNPHSIVA